MLLFLSFSHSWIVLYLPLGSRHSKVKHLAFSFSIGRCIIFPLWRFPCAYLRTKQGKRTRLRNYSPCCTPPYPGRTRCNIHWLFYLSIYFIPFWFRVVDIGLLTLEPSQTFARNEEGSKTLILNPLYVYQELFSFFSFSLSLSLSRIFASESHFEALVADLLF